MANANAEATFTLQKSKTFRESKSQPSEMDGKFGLYMIYSQNLITDIRKFINAHAPLGEEGCKCMRIDYVKDLESGEYKETNRTIAVINNKIAKMLIKAGYGERTGHDFVITPYSIREGNHPPKGASYAFYVIIPKEITKEEAEKQLHEKMDELVECEFIRNSDYTISFPAVSREEETGKYRGHAIITFNTNKVNRNVLVGIKVILNMTRWNFVSSTGEEMTLFCHIAWCRTSALSNLISTRTTRKRDDFKGSTKLKPVITKEESNPFEVLKEVTSNILGGISLDPLPLPDEN